MQAEVLIIYIYRECVGFTLPDLAGLAVLTWIDKDWLGWAGLAGLCRTVLAWLDLAKLGILRCFS